MSTVRYSDTELWDLPETEINKFKLGLTMNAFSYWSISRLQELIKESTERSDWMDPDIKHLRNYRARSQRFYQNKLVKE